MNEIHFSFDNPLAKPTDKLPSSYSHEAIDVQHPAQGPDSSEYLCGHTGNAHPYANAGRDQDRARMDECIPAQPCARYVS